MFVYVLLLLFTFDCGLGLLVDVLFDFFSGVYVVACIVLFCCAGWMLWVRVLWVFGVC